MQDPRDFLPAKPPFLPIPEAIIRRGLNEYMKLPVPKVTMTPEERLLSSLFAPKTVLMVKCRGCGEWLKDKEAIYLNNLAYHPECAAKLYEE